MKIIGTLIFLLFFQFGFSQNCGCKTQPELKDVISCEKTIFKNGAKLYWEYNCDSSWVIFESKGKNKKVLFSLPDELMGYTGRLGFAVWTEYKNSFVVEYHTISGCCEPYEYLLYNIDNGEQIANIGRYLFRSEIKKYPFFVTIEAKNFNYLSFLNLETNKIFKINFPKNRIVNTLKFTNNLFAEVLFENGNLKNGIFQINYKYKNSEKDNWHIAKITVDLNKQLN